MTQIILLNLQIHMQYFMYDAWYVMIQTWFF